MSEDIAAYGKDARKTVDIPAWESLPDIGLYMDQVITYLERILGQGEAATPSMVNNYVKAGILPRAEGKKYGPEHLAILIVAFALKRVLSMQDIRKVVEGGGGEGSVRSLYEEFRSIAGRSAREIEALACEQEALKERGSKASSLALRLAVEAGARSRLAQTILATGSSFGGEPLKKKKGAARRKAEPTA